MTTRVAVIGNHKFHHCSEAQWARAFAALGCDVWAMQVDDVAADPEAAMMRLRHAELVTYTRTHSRGMYLDETWTDRWADLERAGVRTVGLHLDRFWDLEREHLIRGDAQFTVGTLWSADGGNDYRFAKAGVNHRWLIPAVDADDVMGGRFRQEMAHDVVFVGSGGTYHAAYPERLELIAHLRGRFGPRFAHYGHGGDYPVVRGQQLNDLYASARTVVGDACFANSRDRRVVNYTSDRLFESLGRGAFLVWPWQPGLDKLYEPWVDYAVHLPGDWDDLDQVIEMAGSDAQVRSDLARHGRDRTLREHTWTDRMRTVIEHAELVVPADVVAIP